MNNLKRKLSAACVAASTLLACGAHAAIKPGDVLNNSYFSPSEDGRGVLVNFFPLPDGEQIFFGALYTYDEAGEPLWLTMTANFLEFQFEATAQVRRFEGGTFGFPFNPADVTGEVVGTATVTLNSCSNISFDLDMNPSSGLPSVDLGGLRTVAAPNETCVYDQPFTACPSFSTPFGAIPRACTLTGVYTQDITLSNEITWVLDGLVRVGNDNADSATVTIEPGTVLIGAGQTTDYLYISPGSQIIANGTPAAPIILTSPQDGFDAAFDNPQPGDLGGLVVSGNAPCNGAPCFSEFDQTQPFGGDDPTESSGEITYFQVRYAGIEFQENAEVNSFTFQGVGSGTKVSHIQAFRGQDDGVEFFGGTVNVNYLVVTEGGDDAVDWDLGYSGNLQYGLVWNGEGFGEDFGIEGASNNANGDALPRSIPTMANYTFMGNGNGSVGFQYKQGSGGRIYNSIVNQFPTCIEWNGSAVYNAAGTPAAPNTDVAAYNGVIINCATDFKNSDGAPYSVADFFNSAAFENNVAGNPQLMPNSYMPAAGSTALSGGVQVPDNQFFNFTTYRGGFDGSNDWTKQWTHQVTGGSD